MPKEIWKIFAPSTKKNKKSNSNKLMTENEFLASNNLFGIRLMKSILAGIIPNEVITKAEQDALRVVLHKWEHNLYKSFEVSDEDEVVKDDFSTNSEADEHNVSRETLSENITETSSFI